MNLEQILALAAMNLGEPLLAIAEDRASRLCRTEAAAGGGNTIAILPLQGALRARGGMDIFRARLADAMANPDVGAIVLDVDTPGGTVAGTMETAEAVKAASQVKPVTAMVDGMCASAGYWIASQASSIVATPSAEVGSIGVLALHMEFSAAMQAAGVKATIMRSTPYKAEGNMFEPLSDEAKAQIESEVSASHADFVRAVAMGRRTSQAKVSSDFGQGRMVGAQKALDTGMIDRIGSMADVLSGMRTKHSFRRRASFAL